MKEERKEGRKVRKTDSYNKKKNNRKRVLFKK